MKQGLLFIGLVFLALLVLNLYVKVRRLKDLLTSQTNGTEGPVLSDRVKELAEDRATYILAIKTYRDETGAGLADAKHRIDDYLRNRDR